MLYKFRLYRCKSLKDVPLYVIIIYHPFSVAFAVRLSRLGNVCVFWIPRLPRSPAVCRVAHGRRCPIREALYPNWARRCCAGWCGEFPGNYIHTYTIYVYIYNIYIYIYMYTYYILYILYILYIMVKTWKDMAKPSVADLFLTQQVSTTWDLSWQKGSERGGFTWTWASEPKRKWMIIGWDHPKQLLGF